MKMLSKRWCAMLLCLLALFCLLPVQVFAAGAVDTTARCSLKVEFTPEDIVASDVEFRVYRVGDLSAAGRFSLVEPFADEPLSIGEPTSDTWRELAVTLQGYVASNSGLKPEAAAKTDAKGFATFTDLPVGLYLVMGDQYIEDDVCYTPTASLISLPSGGADGSWDYSVEGEAKYSFQEIEKTVDIEVLKIWKDKNYSKRPAKVEVELYNGKKLHATVTLEKENNWRHQWEELPADGIWSVKEKEVPKGYSVSVEQQGDRFVVTNTRSSGAKPDSDPDSDDDSDSDSADDKVPQTGMLWWPVPVLFTAGLLLILLGWMDRRRTCNE